MNKIERAAIALRIWDVHSELKLLADAINNDRCEDAAEDIRKAREQIFGAMDKWTLAVIKRGER